ncbi:MAG: aminotransferase class IV [Myxococcaceae bacterium]
MFEVFTTVLVKNGEPQWLEQHLERLKLHARLAGLNPETSPPTPLHPVERGEKPYLMRISINSNNWEIKTREFIPPPSEAYTQGVSVYLSDQIATSQLKTNQRQVYDLAYEQARKNNAFEGLLLNQEGYLVDGSRSSLLLRQDNTLIILEGGIEGITRQQICLRAKKLGFKIKRAYLKPSELHGQLLIAGTGIGLVPVISYPS